MLSWDALFGGWGEFLPKCVVAICTAIACFRMADNRVRTVGLLCSLAISGIVIQAALWLLVDVNDNRNWQVASALGVVGFVGLLLVYGRQWLQRSPKDMHLEETTSANDTASQSKPAQQEARRLRRAGRNAQGARPNWIEISALTIIGIAYAFASFVDLDTRLLSGAAGGADVTGTSGGLPLGMLKLHWAVVSMTWGIGLFYCVQLTSVSSPSDFDPGTESPVKWLRPFAFATILFVLSMVVCGSIFFAERRPERIETVRDQLMPMVFALTWLILSFVVWMIPARLYRFDLQGQAKEWVSLALAAWIAFLCLGLVAFLPSAWPWSWM